MGERNRGVTPSFLMDEREQAEEGGGVKAREEESGCHWDIDPR